MNGLLLSGEKELNWLSMVLLFVYEEVLICKKQEQKTATPFQKKKK